MAKIKIIFTIGIGLDAQNNEISSLTYKELSTKTFTLLAKAYGGYTAKETLGGWVDDKGNLIEEKSLQIECLHETDQHIDQIRIQANHLGFALASLWNQQCVVVETQFTDFNFISQSLDQKI